MRRVAAGAALVALAACTGGGDGADVTVLAAASLTDVFEAIGAAYEDDAGVTVAFSFAASSSLREQVLGGAPADVVATAAPEPMQALVDAGEVDGPRVFARNRLALAVPAGNPAGVGALDDLADPDLLLGVCAEPVPCGALAIRVLDEAGVAVEPDTEEPDVRSLLTKLIEGELDAGLVYVTDVRAAGAAVVAVQVLDGGGTDYPVAVADRAGDRAAATGFVDFVLGPEGRRLLADAGFEVP